MLRKTFFFFHIKIKKITHVFFYYIFRFISDIWILMLQEFFFKYKRDLAFPNLSLHHLLNNPSFPPGFLPSLPAIKHWCSWSYFRPLLSLSLVDKSVHILKIFVKSTGFLIFFFKSRIQLGFWLGEDWHLGDLSSYCLRFDHLLQLCASSPSSEVLLMLGVWLS